VSTRKAFDLVTSRALWISLLRMVSTPRPAASGAAASRIASSRLRSASVPSALGGRMAPVTTTGRSDLTVRCRKYAVSSSVAVPWVMTNAV